MIQFYDISGDSKVAKITIDDKNKKIASTDDILNFFGDCYLNNCLAMIIGKEDFDESFFDLKTGIAGDILQKMSNYSMRLAIVGDFSKVESKSLRDFIRESNRRKFINFVSSDSEALDIFRLI